ncbi:hypothetical protein FRC10_010467 [Ceratobasidium sp. 414]|nr:hypothetical protein FRC10_010467 [Ceratobasidium sp. 414]
MSDDNPEPQPRLKPGLDDNLGPIELHTLQDWNARFDEAERRDDEYLRRDIFALTGQYNLDGTSSRNRKRRAGLDIQSCRIPADMYITTVCDIDSVIGIVAGSFPINDAATFMYYMLPDVKHTLSANLHVEPIKVRDENGDEILVPPHKLPNARLGTMNRLVVRIALPNLLNEPNRAAKGQPNYIDESYLRLLYDHAIQPATMQTLSEDVRRQWPQRYSNEMFRAAPHLGQQGEAHALGGRQPQQTGREVHGQDFNAWLADIRRRVDNDPKLVFAQGFLLMVEGKGLKNINLSAHAPPEAPLADGGVSPVILHAVLFSHHSRASSFLNQDGNLFDANNPRTTAINNLLADLEPADFRQGEWFLDIATTASARAHGPEGPTVCLMVNSDMHPELIHHFSREPIDQCDRWVQTNRGGYQRDELAHVAHFAGFRMPFAQPAAYGLQYLQVYTTDKSVAYHTDGLNKAKRTSPHGVLTDWKRVHDNHCVPLANSFLDSASSHSVAVRIESRVPFESGWRWRRTVALTSILDRFAEAADARSKLVARNLPEVGSLLIIVVWMLNALVNRPDDGGNYDQVNHAGSVHAIIDDSLVPIRPLGMYCLHSLRLCPNNAKVPRISTHRTLPGEKVVYFCSSSREQRTSLDVLRLFRASPGGQARRPEPHDPWRVGTADDRQIQVQPNPPRRPNRQRRVNIRPADDAPDVLAGRIVHVEQGERYSSEDDDHEEREAPMSLSQQVSNIVYAFPVQIFAKAPNRSRRKNRGRHRGDDDDDDDDDKDGGSWCTLEPEELAGITTDIFADVSKPDDVFVSHHNFGRDYDKWDKTVNTYFPTYEEREAMRPIQGLSQLSVWEDWRTLLADAPPNVAAQMVREARRLVNTEWGWLPWCTKDHLWATGKASSRGRQQGPISGGPWIVYNPRFRPRQEV